MRTARDAPGPAAPRACAGTGLRRTRRRWRRAHAAYRRPDRRQAGQGAGEQAWRDAEFGILVTGVARSRFHTPTHTVPVLRGSSVRPVARHRRRDAAADAADLVWHIAGRHRPPDALRRADTLAQADPPAAMTARQPD
jgi:hypothetical protein